MSQPMTPPPAPQKKMGPLAWLAIGCGAIAVIGILAVAAGGWFLKKKVVDRFEDNPVFAAAELAIRANPELELVESDADKGTLTVRNKQTGEVITMNAKDAKEGKFVFTTKDGTSTFDASGGEDGAGEIKVTNEKGEEAVFSAGTTGPKNLPAWVPSYPGGAVQGSYDATTNQERAAAFTVTTVDPVQKVMEFYEGQLKGAGLKIEKTSYETDGNQAGTLTGTTEDQKRTVNVVISSSEGQTSAFVTFSEKQ